jgi:hypothetical protein
VTLNITNLIGCVLEKHQQELYSRAMYLGTQGNNIVSCLLVLCFLIFILLPRYVVQTN